MKVYRFLPTARAAIEHAGLKQSERATANNIARAFAEATHTEQQTALHLLFEVFDDGREAKRLKVSDAAD
jgi:hypothetical protein